MQSLNIVIVGMGEAGKHITRVLLDEGHNLVLVDGDADAIKHVEEHFDAMVLRGHGASPRILKEAGVDKADMFVAVTNQDEVNMLAALQAKALGARKVIARVSNQVYFDDHRGIHTDMFGSIDLVLNPELLVAVEIQKLVGHTGVVAVQDFANNRIEMVEMHALPMCEAAHKPLKELKLPNNTLIAAIDRKGELIIPSGNDIVEPGDEILAVGRIEQIPDLERCFTRAQRRRTRKVFIVGGTEIGQHVARELARAHIQVTFVEQNQALCEQIVERLGHKVTVLRGDGTDVHLLEEEGAGRADVFIAASNADEVNLMAALLARDLGAPQVIALVHKPDYAKVCQRLGVDATLSPRLAAAQHVLTHVRAGRIQGVRPVLDGRGEFLEIVPSTRSRALGKPLKAIDFPKGANICAVVGRRGAFVPRGDDVIEPGDRVVVFTTRQQREAVERTFAASSLFS